MRNAVRHLNRQVRNGIALIPIPDTSDCVPCERHRQTCETKKYSLLHPKMTMLSEPELKSGDGQASPLPTSIPERFQQHQEHETIATTMIVPEKGHPDPEKLVHTQDIQGEISRLAASSTAQPPRQILAFPTSPDEFGRDCDEYIGGYKLLAALVGIVSVFFIVLLDFSIISTVSMDGS